MKKKSIILWGVFSLVFAAVSANADDGPPRCYGIEMAGSHADSVVSERRIEQWCYQSLEWPAGSTFIYNADELVVRPELAFVVNAERVITHGSLMADSITIHRVSADQFIPFSVPITEPMSFQSSAPTDSNMKPSARETLKLLIESTVPVEDLRLQGPGILEESATANIRPWRGYWWPYRGEPLAAPLEKYDAFVQSRTGSSSGAKEWEKSRHQYDGVRWEGHCNGWAASSVLRKEPSFTRVDSSSGVRFSVSDQKGLLADTDYCASVAFFGRRYRNGGDLNDIYPAEFHKTVTYYIGRLKKPIAVDYERRGPVENNIVSGYSMRFENSGADVIVTARLAFHGYDRLKSNKPGTAGKYHRTYKYRLTKDSQGNYTEGEWLSTNPDFIWVPLGIADCGSNNPNVRHSVVQKILDLPQ